MRSTKINKSTLRTSVLTAGLLLATNSVFAASTTVNLTAQRMSTTMADGNTVPMWGLCTTDAAGAATLSGATLTGGACGAATNWMPGPTITIPYDAAGTSLTINLINNLPTPTSIVILGQLGGGVGKPVADPNSPVHAPQAGTTWPGNDPTVTFTPPTQGARARSFSPETGANAGTNAYSWTNLKPGTYIYETGTHPSIQAPMGLYGLLIVTTAPNTAVAPAVAGTAYPAISYDADAALLFSEIDPKLNNYVETTAAAAAGCPAVTGVCTGTINEALYPPAVNYTPIYFLINGHSFDPTSLQTNALPIPATVISGNVLVRLANAGLHSHVPTTLGLPMSVVAEDGNVLPGNPKIKSQLLMPAGKTLDVVINPPKDPVNAAAYLPAAYGIFDRELSLSANKQQGGMQAILQVGNGALPSALACQATNDNFTAKANSPSFSGNVLSNDRGISNVVTTQPASGTVTLDPVNGNFTYVPTGGVIIAADSFTYTGTCIGNNTAYTATVSLNVADPGVPTAVADTYASKVASLLTVKAPGVLVNDTDSKNYKLTAALDVVPAGLVVILQSDGSFTAQPSAPGTYTFSYHAVNAQGTASTPVNVTLTFVAGSGLQVSVLDTLTKLPIDQDYSWIIEEDQTYYHDPKNPAGTIIPPGTTPQSLATNFHHSYMPVIAAGCTGPRSCGDLNTLNGGVKKTAADLTPRAMPSAVVLDPTKRYFISVLPGDASDGNPDSIGTATPQYGHSIGGSSISAGQLAVNVLTPRNPMPGGQISVIVFEDSGPTNGGVDADEPGLGGFTIKLFDTRGSTGDPAGEVTYDLAGMPMTNALAGTMATDGSGANLCPLPVPKDALGKPLPMGVITTCPELDDQGNVSPLAGMALIKNVEPGRYDVLAIPGADRAVKGENWIQVSTLEGTPVNDTFVKAGEPGYWQEFGSPGFHSFIGFINPAHVAKARTDAISLPGAVATNWSNTVTGNISSLHMDRPPAAVLNDSCATPGTVDATCRASLNFTQCQVSLNLNATSGTGKNIAYAQCDQNGNFTLTGIPSGLHELVIWDQWLDQIIAKKAVNVPAADNQVIAMGSIPVFSWFTRIEQTAFIDLNGDGIRQGNEPGLPMIPLNNRFRDGSISNYLATDLTGNGGTNELFPLFNWYVLETDTTRYKGTGVHVVYDAGGKPDTTGDFAGVLNSTETTSLPANLQVPGALYTAGKTERVDPGSVVTEGVQGFINQTAVIDWGKTPYLTGENGGITGMVYYASTRAFDDPALETQLSWEPGVPHVKVNLYAQTTNADGSLSLSLVDSTTTSSWDDNASSLHCPGDPATDPFVTTTLGSENQFKCYDGQHVFNQIQPAVYDGRYRFPSNPAKQLPTGKYVVEVVLPDGYEIVKEEDNNIFNGDSWLNPSTATQFAGLGNIFILPDQATLNSSNVTGAGAAFPPCVGRPHHVPDYLSLFPELQNFAPFGGQDRALCDRKLVTLNEQAQAAADFQVFTPAPVAAHFTGIMLNDAAAEFDRFSPSFGEKAALPNAPISFRDYNGVEIGRVYNDKYGSFNGLMPSSFEANVPNPSGYAPNMITSCMNDPGPIADPTGAIDPATGKVKLIIDPMYNPMFSNFCYVWPYMPGQTTYLDTPVLPTAAYANASSYAPVDCQYTDATPAIARVDVVDPIAGPHIGPWIDHDNHGSVTIQALGDVSVLNPSYDGPTALTAPANQPRITRHYGFGAAQGTGTVKLFGPDLPATGFALPIATWTDGTITTSLLPELTEGNYQMVITAANGKQSVDAVTVHVVTSGYVPVVVHPVDPQTSLADGLAHPVQDAIDAAKPGDLIILDSGSYPELVVMWKPVQLQGVGAALTVINATKYPNQKVRDWRTKINSLFGLDDQGNQLRDALGNLINPQVDPLPGQEITGGILQLEPSVLASEEGAGITVLAKGLRTNGNPLNAAGDCNVASANYSVSNFLCYHAGIDGVTVTGGDAGGGIYVNGWAHGLEIANNRVYGNAGPFNGGVRIGQPYLEGQAALPANANANLSNFGLAYDVNVNIHHNAITTNGMVEGAPGAVATANAGGAGGGLSICAGSDNYKVTSNWICGNYSSADGGGIGHIGHSRNGTISKNFILFNESYNQTGIQNGGGLAIEGEAVGGLGTGNVTVDANVIQGNFARAGNGGGVRLQNVNGLDTRHPQAQWWRVNLINNMISNNMAGWSGGGVSLADTVNSRIINNTIAANDTVGLTGNLFNHPVGAASTGPATGLPGPAGVSTETSSPSLVAIAPISSPILRNNVIWQNRSFYFDLRTVNNVGTAMVIASNNWNDALVHAGNPLAAQTVTGECVAGAAYWDLGVTDVDQTPAMGVNHLNPEYSVLTAQNGYPVNNNKFGTDPKLIRQYCNGSRVLPGLQFEPGTPFQPDFQLAAAATLDESGNFVDLHFGPISLTDPGNPAQVNGDYHLLDATSPAFNAGSSNGAPNHDFDGDTRPQNGAYEIGADELVVALPVASLSTTSISFGSVTTGTTAFRTVTVTNTGNAPLVMASAVVTNTAPATTQFAKAADTCSGNTIGLGASCTITVSFSPVTNTLLGGTLTITDNALNSPQTVALSGR